MPGLADFLLARIAEDEAVARAAVQTAERGGRDSWYWSNAGEAVFLDESSTPVLWGDEHSRPAGNHIARHDPARVLADCEAKRGILKLTSDSLELEGPGV